MGTTLNRAAYEKLIAEDIEWVSAQPKTLERDHIVQVLRASPGLEYDLTTEREQHGIAVLELQQQVDAERERADGLAADLAACVVSRDRALRQRGDAIDEKFVATAERDAANERGEAEHRRAERHKARCREAAQALIAEIGATGPEDIEDTAGRAVEVIRAALERAKRAEAENAERHQRILDMRDEHDEAGAQWGERIIKAEAREWIEADEARVEAEAEVERLRDGESHALTVADEKVYRALQILGESGRSDYDARRDAQAVLTSGGDARITKALEILTYSSCSHCLRAIAALKNEP
jgi:hypothetical protein